MNCESQSTLDLLSGIAKGIERMVKILAEQEEANCRVPSTGLYVSERERRAFWYGDQLPINGHRDFDVLLIVYRARGAIISQPELLRHICPGSISDHVIHLCGQAPEVKDALHHIRRACREIGAPDFIEVVRGRGYRLRNLREQSPFIRLSSAPSSSPSVDDRQQQADGRLAQHHLPNRGECHE